MDPMASPGLLQDSMPSPPTESASTGSRFHPYSSPNHRVTKGRYITSNDPRGYVPVYEYPLNGQWIMMDMDDGYILWTGIWKALGNSKADIVKMLESQPDLAPQLRRVRGGYLKIQGTWMPYEVALRLARRVAWPIREDLVPLFGPTFPTTCLSPDQAGYGQIVLNSGRRKPRRVLPQPMTTAARPTKPMHPGAPGGLSIARPPMPSSYSYGPPPQQMLAAPPHNRHYSAPQPDHSYYFAPRESSATQSSLRPTQPHYSTDSYASQHYYPSSDHSGSPVYSNSPPLRERTARPRYSPYPSANNSSSRTGSSAMAFASPSVDIGLHSRSSDPNIRASASYHQQPSQQSYPSNQGSQPQGSPYTLPPISSIAFRPEEPVGAVGRSLPPISSLDYPQHVPSPDSASVLRRLRIDDEENSSMEEQRPSDHILQTRRRSLSAPPYNTTNNGSIPASDSWPPPPPPLPTHYEANRWGDEYPHHQQVSEERQYQNHRPASIIAPSPSLTYTSHRDHDAATDPSPVTPATPWSGFAPPPSQPINLPPVSSSFDQRRSAPLGSPPLQRVSSLREYTRERGASFDERLPSPSDLHRMSASRLSQSSEDETSKPVRAPMRPW